MNNQFSQRVSDIITYSKEEANRLRNRYIGPVVSSARHAT